MELPPTTTPETDEIFCGERNHAYLFSRMRKMETERNKLVRLVEAYIEDFDGSGDEISGKQLRRQLRAIMPERP